MSIRAIASIGVMLSLAMTSFSIYLGVIEHAYSPGAVRELSLRPLGGRETVCLQYHVQANAVPTVMQGSPKTAQCTYTSR